MSTPAFLMPPEEQSFAERRAPLAQVHQQSRVGMSLAAFGACELGRQLREKKLREKKQRRASQASGKMLGAKKVSFGSSSFNRMRNTYSKQRPLFMEMLKTERAYVDSLHVVVSHFMLPLQVALENFPQPIISKKELGVIFGNIAQLFEVNMELLRIIESNLGLEGDAGMSTAERTEDGDLASAFAEAFTNMLPVFKAFYSVYSNNYEKSIEELEECRVNNPVFRRFLKVAKKHESCQGLDLGDYLIKPVQRICKYPLFFRGLLDCTDSGHPMYNKLVAAASAVQKIAEQVNQTSKDASNALKCLQIAKQLEGLDKYDPELQIVAPGRRFELEFQCKIHYSFQAPGAKPTKEMLHEPYKKKPRECFLFNDVLLITKSLGETRRDFRFWLDLENLLISIPPSHTVQAGDADSDNDEQQGFSSLQRRLPLDIVRIRVNSSPQKTGGRGHKRNQTDGSVVEKYTLWFKSAKERSQVHERIQHLQDALETRSTVRAAVLNQHKSINPLDSPEERAINAAKIADNVNSGGEESTQAA